MDISATINILIEDILKETIIPNIRCDICKKSVLTNQHNIAYHCKKCDKWTHRKCNNTTDSYLISNQDQCLKCSINFSLNNIPFTSCTNLELSNLNTCNSLKLLNALPSFEIVAEVSAISEMQANEVNLNMAFQADCSYYNVQGIQKLKIDRNLNIFHTNINGLETKMDNLHEFLSSTASKMDIVAITETSQKNEEHFISNTDIDGYVNYSTSSNLCKGGTALYIKDKYDSFEITDLKIQNDNFESTWVEVVNKLSKNIVVASIYRHPRYNLTEFTSYLETCLNKLIKEKKEIYLCGDFNIDLLLIENNSKYQQFYDMLCSYGFLPKITQPTRVTEYTSSLIDNIFSNNIIDDTKSGNILLTLSEHFSQFVSVKRGRLDYKNIIRFQHDYSKFHTEDFRDDVSIQNWNTNLNNANDLFEDFHHTLKGCVDRHLL